ncbi:hypothetical protein F5Y14DRAFT_421189 [Nemania sp. NC0429]|nr:hypothetical protein F5Y14DRAFT_421189 [Nemania sp. NC0429]
MRLASRISRDAQLKRTVPRSWTSLLFLSSRPCANGIGRLAVRADHGTRPFSTSWSLPSGADYDLIHSELPHTPRASITTSLASQPTASSSLVQETKHFHKWGPLLMNPTRLAIESDFFRLGSAKTWHRRLLVDKFANQGDIALWTCLLDYQMRINGPSGVARVWKALWGRKTLYDVDSPLAEPFWRVMLEGALMSEDPSVLDSIWVYSEWMYELHRVRWPRLYTTIIKHLLRTHQHQRVLQWQLLLAPNFYPGADEFADIIIEFALDKELNRLGTLHSLYKTSPEKKLYNTLLPYLYDLGESNLARQWRRLFIRHGEVPLAPAPLRPLLRYVKGYHPHDTLEPAELAVLKLAPEPVDEEEPTLSREFVNRVHGQTFGITVKKYNDRLGAKWFASSFMTLDMAMSGVSALGIEKIGPLSFQSIALRAGNSEELLNRVSQLREHAITVVDSNYVQAILYLARHGDNELLDDILRSDLHPDVFDDLNLLTRLIDSAADVSDWRTLRLLLTVRLALFEPSARGLSNSVLRLRFHRGDEGGVVQILEDMKAKNIPLDVEEANHIYDSLIEDYNRANRSLHAQAATFYLAIFRQLKTMDVAVPLTHWRLILLHMARRGRLDDFEKLAVELVDMFVSSLSQRPGFFPLHVQDAPAAMKDALGGVENLLGVYIPQDLLKSHRHHPLRELFNNKVLTDVIENAFIAHPGQGFRAEHDTRSRGSQSPTSQIVKMLQLLRLLYERGMWLHIRKVQFVLTSCLVTIYGPTVPATTPQRMMRASNTLTLGAMKTLVDRAWGRTLLPPLDKLKVIIQERDPGANLENCEWWKLADGGSGRGEDKGGDKTEDDGDLTDR